MSGVDLPGRELRKGAVDGGARLRGGQWRTVQRRGEPPGDDIAGAAPRRWRWPKKRGGSARVLGVIELKDIVKGGIKERFAELRRMAFVP